MNLRETKADTYFFTSCPFTLPSPDQNHIKCLVLKDIYSNLFLIFFISANCRY
jgi:hypothetical protein